MITAKDVADQPLTEEHRVALLRVIETTKKQGDAFIFAEPVDFMKLGIPDYIKVIQKPMDLSTLRRYLFQYRDLGSFLRDSELIWSNCKTYNGNAQGGYYQKVANDTERFFVQQVCRIKGLGLTQAFYKRIVGKLPADTPDVIAPREEEFTTQHIQQIVKKLQELPEFYMLECLKWYTAAKGETFDSDKPQFQLQFKVEDAQLLRALQQKIDQKASELKEERQRRAKEAKEARRAKEAQEEAAQRSGSRKK